MWHLRTPGRGRRVSSLVRQLKIRSQQPQLVTPKPSERGTRELVEVAQPEHPHARGNPQPRKAHGKRKPLVLGLGRVMRTPGHSPGAGGVLDINCRGCGERVCISICGEMCLRDNLS